MRLTLTALLMLATTMASAAEQNLLFILDASGSMWGRIDDTPKISVAKDVMSDLVDKLPEDSRAGLLAYGHRRKGDCSDIESLVTLGPLDRHALTSRIQGLNPKGKTPITEAVKQAVDELRTIEGSASIVLVSDGLESCGGDPCEAVRAARSSGVDFRLHVVGFDLGDADPQQLRCMAEAGGGEFYTAANADELTGALERAVAVKPGLVLAVVSNGEPTRATVVPRKSANGDGAAGKLEEAYVGDSAEDNPQRIALEPGTYDIRVTATALDGNRQKILTGLTIPESGEVERTVDFSDGRLAVELTANGELQNGWVGVFAADDEDNRIARRYPKANPENNPRRFRLPPGDYAIKATADGISAPAKWVRNISVRAGETTAHTVDFSAGTLAIELTANGELQNGWVGVFAADDEDNRIARRYPKANPENNPRRFRLPPGDYAIKATADGISAPAKWVRNISVRAGETTARTVDFSAGTLAVELTANGELQKGWVGVFAADDEDNRIARRYPKANPENNPRRFRLPPGDYAIKATADGISAPAKWVRDINIRAGETTSRSIDFAAGTLSVGVTVDGQLAKGWIGVYPAGNEDDRIARRYPKANADNNPRYFRLPPGEYDVYASAEKVNESGRWLRAIEITAGSTVEKTMDFRTDE